MQKIRVFSLLASISLCLLTQKAKAQMVSTEQEFQNLFVTAGYGTAFGAAFGAALLSFQQKPEDNLRFIAIGASVGFITGSLLGSYVIFSPVFTSDSSEKLNEPFFAKDHGKLYIVPGFDPEKSYKLTRLEGQVNLLRF